MHYFCRDTYPARIFHQKFFPNGGTSGLCYSDLLYFFCPARRPDLQSPFSCEFLGTAVGEASVTHIYIPKIAPRDVAIAGISEHAWLLGNSAIH